MTAQSFVFYIAGFETSSSTMSFCLFEIAKNPDIQQKVQEEIDAVLAKHNGQFTYESINELKYLESCIDGLLLSIYTLFCEICFVTIQLINLIVIEVASSVLKFYPNPTRARPDRMFCPTLLKW